MKLILILLLSINHVWGHEKELKTKADLLAYGIYKNQNHHPWPFHLQAIGHNMQSYQFYGGTPYWHDGLDIISLPDQAIYASVGGKIVNIENYQPGNPLYWEVAILDADGFIWKYHHVNRKSIPEEIIVAYKTGVKISAGTLIGNVVRWNAMTFGVIYHHLHLLIVGKDGQYINPFLMMEPLADTRVPVIKRIGLAKNHRPIDGHIVSGTHALYLEASDLTLHEKFILPPYKISYKLDEADEKVVWEFIHLPSAQNDLDFIKDFYMEGTCGNYDCRKFFFNLNFTVENPRKTMNLKPGKHEVIVFIEDIVGNKTSEHFQWQVL